MSRTVIVAAKRTPIAKLSGAFASLSAPDLAGVVLRQVLADTHLDPATVDAVILGQVLQAGQGQITARQAAVAGGVPMSVHATTVNKVCLSGLQSLYLADLMIRCGDADVVVCGGMESMTQAPYLLAGARGGYRYGHHEVLDSLVHDALTCSFDHCTMGLATERHLQGQLSRQRQDEFAARSHTLAAAAHDDGFFEREMVPVPVRGRKGPDVVVATDEGVRRETSVDTLSHLRPAFDPTGTITAGNASQISDGAAVIVATSERRARDLGLDVLGELVGYGQVAGPDTSLLLQPAHAIRAALARTDATVADLDVVEINEAFAAVALASQDDLGLVDERMNLHGGAIALGHPVGMSGARLVVTALNELERRGGGLAAVALCGGGGQGDAALLRRL